MDEIGLAQKDGEKFLIKEELMELSKKIKHPVSSLSVGRTLL
jgi:hypothetical protein